MTDLRTVRVCWLASVLALVGAGTLQAQYYPRPENHVEDRAGVIDSGTERRLINLLAQLEQKTGAQMLVLTVKTTQGIPIEEYAIEQAMRWKLGKKDRDDGVLAVIAVEDRNYSIQIGYGLEPELPDGLVGAIGRDYFQPNFKRDNYSAGIYDGMANLAQRIAEAKNASLGGATAPNRGRTSQRTGQRSISGVGNLLCSCGLPIFVVLMVILSARNRGRAYRSWGGGGAGNLLLGMMLGNILSGGRRGGGWGGGFGGGGFGGGGFGGGSFGGGGGGSFGGGGASGSW